MHHVTQVRLSSLRGRCRSPVTHESPSSPGSTAACPVGPPESGIALLSFLVSHDLWKSTAQLFCRVSLYLGLSLSHDYIGIVDLEGEEAGTLSSHHTRVPISYTVWL